MNDYISREAAVVTVKTFWGCNLRNMLAAMEEIHAADVRPVVHGKLIHETIDTHSSVTGKVYLPPAICSICGSRVIGNVNYCPICGVDVREEVQA